MRMLPRFLLRGALGGLLMLGGGAAAPRVDFRLARADGDGWITPQNGQGSSVFLFWDSACPGCLLELADLPALQQTVPAMRIVLVSLSPREDTRRVLSQYTIPETTLLARSPLNPRGLLAQLGNTAGALPFAVVFSPDGSVCVRHFGQTTRTVLRSADTICRGRS